MTDYTTPEYSKGDRVIVTAFMDEIPGVVSDVQHLRGDWLYTVQHGGEIEHYRPKQLKYAGD